ncbi:hypothetical protein [Lentzea albida]|uniref:hypothetical protein n=1 Tax=Lentzea albida TaxID=65499 RepID=UPI0011603DB8|nr:hypothetical protein [Lentzea albida]
MCTTFTATGAVAEPATCDWVVSKVPAPSGYEDARTEVKGTDSHGNYSGTSLRPGTNTNDVVLWTGGKPEVVQELAHLQWAQVADENSAGTVLVNGYLPAAGRWAPLRYSGGHRGAGTISELTAPAGYRANNAISINARGDVLGNGTRIATGESVTLLWSTIAAAPQVIEWSVGYPQDLDDDGTVLFRHPSANGGLLWRNGVVTPLEHRGKPQYVQAIRGGRVVGHEVTSWPNSQALLWDATGAVTPIEGGGSAFAINAGGLVTGQRTSLTGKAGVWRTTAFEAELPLPDGVSGVSELFVAGDDDSLFSKSGSGPLRWSCE